MWTEVLTFAVFGAEHLPALSEEFANNKEFKQVDVSALDDVELAIKKDIIKFAMVIPEEAQELTEQGKQIAIQLYFDDA